MGYKVGLDIGSTTVKIAVMDENEKLVYSEYQRHYANIKETIQEVVGRAYESCLEGQRAHMCVTGSGGLAVSQWIGIPFVQEVIAATRAVEKKIPETNVAIELGGEDAKITYFDGTIEQRMNGTCAGGTGAFIDQMAGLLKTDASGLNRMAKESTTIYPIAARCGVFAKTDVQPLINEGAPKADIAASIFQAVVNQTIAGLACGKPIRGNVAFLGGPLSYLSELVHRFVVTLNLKDEQVIRPENAQLFVAMGAAYMSEESSEEISFDEIYERTQHLEGQLAHETERLAPIFESDEEYRSFRRRHDKAKVKRGSIEGYEGPVYLGIDAGSTTTKAVLMDDEYRLLYTCYGNNEGSPLDKTKHILEEVYRILPEKAYIAGSCSTGYGEKLIQTAYHTDLGEIETMAHYKAAEHFLPGVEFILDIGGQDMKCIRVRNGIIHDILLNEACSSGCGSFLENFASSMGLSIQDFAAAALKSREPVDLGSRCTVFMNSRVKQAQKEGAGIEDISAGLSYSVIKNALQKVIKIRDYNEMGDRIIVQGGTFYNDAVLGAFEKLTERKVVRPDIAGMMGAFGCAIICKERLGAEHKSTLIGPEVLATFSYETSQKRCGKCANNCLLTINEFSTGEKLTSGNRCERGIGLEKSDTEMNLNLYRYKYGRLFSHYKPLKESEAKHGVVGIPRALNQYENYPFWFTFFTELGFSVHLTKRTTKKTFVAGMETIPSESVCYPAKLTHGHIMELVKEKVPFIFYPCVPYERTMNPQSDNHYNCPIVTSYPETIKNNVEALEENGILFMNPFLNLNDPASVSKELFECVGKQFGLSKAEIDVAVGKAYQELQAFHEDIKAKGEEILKTMRERKMHGIVLAGRPYHVDPEINHGLDKIITELGMAVLTEDSVCEKGHLDRPLRVLDQWAYHSRLYDAAEYVGTQTDLELVQLFSFGCGVDAVTTDQVMEILEAHDKPYTMIKIDEGSNTGAIRIRLRSLLASIEEKERKAGDQPICAKEDPYHFEKVLFTKEMKEAGYTILAPQMSPIHFRLLEKAFANEGYHLEILPAVDHAAVEEGLRYVNNDACYPSILVAGQMMEAVKSGKYDVHKLALIITQTGGGCRASNYISFIRKMLNDSGYGFIPCISLSAGGIEKHPGFTFSLGTLDRAMMAVVYGDVLMRVLLRQRPYERVKGSADELYEKWNAKAEQNILDGNHLTFRKNVKGIIEEFDALEIVPENKPRVGIVGEILVKFHPTGNNELIRVLESEGAEAVVPELLDFFLYCVYNEFFKIDHYGAKNRKLLYKLLIDIMEKYRAYSVRILKKHPRFGVPDTIYKKADYVSGLMSLGNVTGEGWLLSSEMIELLDHGVPNIVCVQPFGCLPNHIIAKSMFKTLRKHYPELNVAAVDYDPGASEVNQLNRIKLMLSVAAKQKN